MVFVTPPWVPEIASPSPLPDSTLVGDFISQRNHDLYNWSDEKPTMIDALSGIQYNMREIRDRVTALSKCLGKELGWEPNKGSPWDKVVGIYSYNTIDFLILCWAIHRLGGICLLLHSTSTAAEIEAHSHVANCKVIFTCKPLLSTCEEVSKNRFLRIFLLDFPKQAQEEVHVQKYKTVSQMISESPRSSELPPVVLQPGQGGKLVAYLCPTSGTSGKQKLAQLTHLNVISNVLQAATFENFYKKGRTETVLGILPLSHSYGLIIGHLIAWRGDCTVLHSRFDMQKMLASISTYKIERLYLVPTIIAALTNNSFLFDMYDVSSVKSVVTGSAAFGPRMAGAFKKVQPSWQILPGYGLTETGVIISFTSAHNVFLGSDGCLFPMVQARLVAEDESDISSHGQSGELLLRSPSIMLGYLGDEEANKRTFDPEGWLRTGDVATFKKDLNGIEHLFIVDRKKDIMKVNGLQVAPVEIEAQLLSHPAVEEVAVIAAADDDAGERPFAFIVRSQKVMAEVDEKTLKANINKEIELAMSEPHWLRKNIMFIEEIPKSHNGKALKYKLKSLLA
ncbi:hypothetical protein ACMFMG_011433 [Clarireedia jacksonii]